MEVQAASGMIVSEIICNRSTPSMTISRSSPRAAKICWSSNEYRGFSLTLSRVTWCGISVGRMPIIARWVPTSSARGSASFSDCRTDCSKELKPASASRRGATLISMLNRPSSVWNDGSAMAASTSALCIAGSHRRRPG